MTGTTRWLFGDQLGPSFTDDHDGPLLLVESTAVFRRRRFHRQKAHLIVSAMRRRVRELEAAGRDITYLQTETYAEALAQVDGPLQVMQPTTRAAVDFVNRIAEEREVDRLAARGYLTTRDEFDRWARSRGTSRLLMEDFYRDARRRLGVLLEDDGAPVGGRWNYDAENREAPPRERTLADAGVPGAWLPEEDEVDAEVRRDLDAWAAEGPDPIRFVGRDGPRRFAGSTAEAHANMDHFLEHRLEAFGTYEDAILTEDRWMAHSMTSAPLNLGLIDPADIVAGAEEAYRRGARLASVEGFIRQVMGWREYIWHLYWWFGEDYRTANQLEHRGRLPTWFVELDGSKTDANCLSHTLDDLADHGWVHHIPRLMILGSYGLQRGWSPQELTDWFHRSFVDGYDWVMLPNIVGMSQHADGGLLATKPYTSGGAYINKMTDYCGDCVFDPKVRVGEDACPYSAGYWWFMARHRERFQGNRRMRQPIIGLDRLSDLAELVEQEEARGSRPPTKGRS